MVLLEDVNSISFRWTDVILICGGVVSLASTFVYFKYSLVSMNEKFEAHVKQNEKDQTGQDKKIEQSYNLHTDTSKMVNDKFNELTTQIHHLETSLIEKIQQMMITKSRGKEQ